MTTHENEDKSLPGCLIAVVGMSTIVMLLGSWAVVEFFAVVFGVVRA